MTETRRLSFHSFLRCACSTAARGAAALRDLTGPGAAVVALAAVASLAPALASAKDPLKALPRDFLAFTTMPVGDDILASLVEYLTGDKTEKTAINLILGIYRVQGQERTLFATRDYNAAAGGFVSRGSLQIIDLDRDGVNEVLVEYHHNEQPGSTRVELDVLRVADGKLVLLWTGPVRVDTTSSALGLPPGERERFVREIDYGRTASTNGRLLCFTKTVSVAAGATLSPPRILPEELHFISTGAPAQAPAGPSGEPRSGK